MIAGSDGVYSGDISRRGRSTLSSSITANWKKGGAGGGGRFGYEYFLDEEIVTGYIDDAVTQALNNLEAVPAPAGAMTVVLGPGWPGILLHEAIGHGLEGDFNRKGTSAFSNPDRSRGCGRKRYRG